MFELLRLKSRVFRVKLFAFAIILLSITTISCKEEIETGPTSITGKIINPITDYVVITNFSDINDTITLNKSGNFNIRYDEIDSGLYSISYPGEYQSFYLIEGDSIGLRGNTKAFDESIAFTGDRAPENNFLMELFADIESGNITLLKYKNQPPQEFYKMVQLVKDRRVKNLERASSKYSFNNEFVDQVKFIIDLNSYYELERYPIVNSGNPYKDEDVNFPEKFFAHRDQLELNNVQLLNNYTYRPYINAMVSNLAFEKLSQKRTGTIDIQSYTYNKSRLEVIDSIFKNDRLKNYFANIEIKQFITSHKNGDDIELLVDDFLDVSNDKSVNQSIVNLAATYIDLEPGNTISNLDLTTIDGNQTDLKKVVDQLSVIYFWSIKDEEYSMGIHNKVQDLQNKYPEINFIGINIDDINYSQWRQVLAENNFNIQNEYRIIGQSMVYRRLALRNNNRSMIISKELKIKDPNINLFNFKIETTLLGYINS